MKKKTIKIVTHTISHIILIPGSILAILPFIWMVSTSLKLKGAVFAFPPELIPRPAIWQNYLRIWQVVPLFWWFLNSTFVAATVTVGQLIICSLGAYAFARLKFPGRDSLFLLYLSMMMIPAQVTMIPLYIITMKLRLLNTYYALILPGLFSAFGTFLLRQFFLSIPEELEEAAIIDGCSYFRIYWEIILPLAKPALAALSVFTFMWSWDNFLWPLVVVSSDRMKTIPIGLASFATLHYGSDWPLLMTCATWVLLPVIIIYLFNQRFMIRGIVLTGLKF